MVKAGVPMQSSQSTNTSKCSLDVRQEPVQMFIIKIRHIQGDIR